MAHGTGYYWERKWNADVEKTDYYVIFKQLRYYYYEQMSDCYEPTWEPLDSYECTVMRWRKNRWGHLVADELSETAEVKRIDRKMANRIWKNLNDKDIPFETVKAFFEEVQPA